MLGAQHCGGLSCRPGFGESFRTVRNPKSGHGHERGILRQYIRFHFFQGIGCGMMRVFIFWGILVHINPRQAGHDKGPGVRSKLNLVGYPDAANVG